MNSKTNKFENYSELQKRILLSFIAANALSSATQLVNLIGINLAYEAIVLNHSLLAKHTKILLDESKLNLISKIASSIHCEKIEEKCEENQIKIIEPNSNLWPNQINNLENDTPILLFVKGNTELNSVFEKSVGIVGARLASMQGVNVAFEISSDLAEKGWTINSGGALGIDSASHRGAISSNGKTVAFLACGLDRVYPKSNSPLFDEILENGGSLISEYPLNTDPIGFRFLERNRLIAACSSSVVVVEAAWRSGALSTVTHANELGKVVCATPGGIYQVMSVGCNELIRNGATLVTNANQIIEATSPLHNNEPNNQNSTLNSLTEFEKTIFSEIKNKTSFQTLTKKFTNVSASKIVGILATFELLGLIKSNEKGEYYRVKEK